MKYLIKTDSQLVKATKLSERKFLWWKQYLMTYKTDYWMNKEVVRTEQTCKWINEWNVIEVED